jgi:hypothetical protein
MEPSHQPSQDVAVSLDRSWLIEFDLSIFWPHLRRQIPLSTAVTRHLVGPASYRDEVVNSSEKAKHTRTSDD